MECFVGLPQIKEDLFTDRYIVLQKMNKLSNILFSKKNNQNVYEINTLNRNTGKGRSEIKMKYDPE